MAYDAWNLTNPDNVMYRWIATALLLCIVTYVWYEAHSISVGMATYKRLTCLLITADIAMASFYVYTQRGMASKAVALYAIPIIVSAILASRSALIATSILCIAAYSTTTISYFTLNFNEGYKIELYGETAAYCISFVLLASLLWVSIRHNGANN